MLTLDPPLFNSGAIQPHERRMESLGFCDGATWGGGAKNHLPALAPSV